MTLKLRLSLRDPEHPEKYLGDKDHWDKAEAVLREVAAENKTEFVEGLGEAAFYAPKLDFMAKDLDWSRVAGGDHSVGRQHAGTVRPYVH